MEESVDYDARGDQEREKFERILDERRRLSPYYTHLGMEVSFLSRGSANMRMSVGENLWNVSGMVHGGAIASMADAAGGVALATLLEIGRERPVTVELKVNFISAVREGLLEARGRVVHKGKNLAVCEADVFDKEDRLVAKALGTYKIARMKEESKGQ